MERVQSINGKLTRVMLFTTGVALIVAFLGFMTADLLSYKKVLERDVATKMELVGLTASAALQFGDPIEAQAAIDVVEADEAIVAAMLFAASGEQVATYVTAWIPLADTTLLHAQPAEAFRAYTRKDYEAYQPILFDGETIGGIWMRYSLGPFYLRLVRYLVIALCVLIGASGIAVLVGNRLRHGISDPILALAATAQQVSAEKDYSVRVRYASNDEIGLLADTFNAMLNKIEQRDQALARHRDELEALVLARTAELQAAKEEAEQASRFKSRILNNITHEFRTPLAGIVGATAVLRDEVDEFMVEFVDMIEGSGQRLLDTLESVLNLARLDAGDIALTHRPLNVSRHLAPILVPFRRVAQQQGLTFEAALDSVQHPVWLDPFVLEVVVKSLLSNAVKFTSAGEVSLVLETTSEHLVITVRDTGIGIGHDFLPMLYEPFKQESTGLTRDYEGSGLGLAVVKRTLDLLGGDITLTTAVGDGSTFAVTLARDSCRLRRERMRAADRDAVHSDSAGTALHQDETCAGDAH